MACRRAPGSGGRSLPGSATSPSPARECRAAPSTGRLRPPDKARCRMTGQGGGARKSAHLSDEALCKRRSQAGCSGVRMPADFCHGLPDLRVQQPGTPPLGHTGGSSPSRRKQQTTAIAARRDERHSKTGRCSEQSAGTAAMIPSSHAPIALPMGRVQPRPGCQRRRVATRGSEPPALLPGSAGWLRSRGREPRRHGLAPGSGAQRCVRCRTGTVRGRGAAGSAHRGERHGPGIFLLGDLGRFAPGGRLRHACAGLGARARARQARRLQRIDAPGIPPYLESRFRDELGIFVEWFLGALLGERLPGDAAIAFETLVDNALGQPQCLITVTITAETCW